MQTRVTDASRMSHDLARGLPRVSIVMPSFQQREFIAEAIESVFTQGVDDLELIVADGGSTDGTPALLAEWAARYPGRLRWRSVPDSGPAQAVNDAVMRARAPIIGWLNSDDRYTPGAVLRALDAFAANPEHVLVYGEGEHVNIRGEAIGRYPSRAPDTPAAEFAAGCFICQPTAFFRRSTFTDVGGLNESLRTAFDFDLWLRLFKAYAGRIGFVPHVQAHSRLHAGSITLQQRERVALEGLEVLRTHLQVAPPEWLLSYFETRLQSHPFDAPAGAKGVVLHAHFHEVLSRARPHLGVGGEAAVTQYLANHTGLRLANEHIGTSVQADGWTSDELTVRIRQPTVPAAALRIRGRSARPDNGALRVRFATEGGEVDERVILANGDFEVSVPLHDTRPGATMLLRFHCPTTFVPAECEPGSSDRRRLGFLVREVDLVGATVAWRGSTGRVP